MLIAPNHLSLMCSERVSSLSCSIPLPGDQGETGQPVVPCNSFLPSWKCQWHLLSSILQDSQYTKRIHKEILWRVYSTKQWPCNDIRQLPQHLWVLPIGPKDLCMPSLFKHLTWASSIVCPSSLLYNSNMGNYLTSAGYTFHFLTSKSLSPSPEGGRHCSLS